MLRWLILFVVNLQVILRYQPQGINEAEKEDSGFKNYTPFRKRYNTDGYHKGRQRKSCRFFLCLTCRSLIKQIA